MKLQRSTVVLVAIALVMGGAVLLTQGPNSESDRPSTAQGDAENSPVFTFEEEDVVGLEIETAGQAVAFERDATGLWQMTQPTPQPAEEAAIAFLLSRLTTDGLRQTTTMDAANQADFGLDVPFATVALTLADGTTHSLALGDADFSGQNYYALIDPATIPLARDAGTVTVAVVTENILNGVDRPLEEWQGAIAEPELLPSDDPAPDAPDASTSPTPEEEAAPESPAIEAAPGADSPAAPDPASDPEEATTDAE